MDTPDPRCARYWRAGALVFLFFACAAPLRAAGRLAADDEDDEQSEPASLDTALIDVPTAAVLDYGSYSGSARFFTGGGVLGELAFGVFQQVNIGASLNVNSLVGSVSPIQPATPELQAKWRFFDGTNVFPALAVGYDGQGYYYSDSSKTYAEKGHGVYLVGTKELGTKGLFVHFGANVPDANSGVAGFLGANWNILDKVSLMAEWDNIRNIPDSRFNAGIRFYAGSSLQIDFAVREIGRVGYYDGAETFPERIVQLKYIGDF